MKVFIIIVGAIIALMGVSCMGAGAAVGATIGTDGWIESDEGQLDTTTHALVSEVADIASNDEDAAEFFDEVDLRIRVTVQSQEKDVFIGVGTADDVTTYLTGVEHETVTDLEFDPLRFDTTPVPGTAEPEPPGDQSFWVQQVSGSGEQELDWDIDAGSFRFVVMNADGSADVNTQAQFALKIPYVTGIMIGLLVVGGFFALVGIITIVLGIRSGRSQAPPTSQAPAGPEQPPPTGPSEAAPPPPSEPPQGTASPTSSQ